MPVVDRSEFYNSPEKLVTVYQKFASRTESYEYDAMGNRTVEKIMLREENGYTSRYNPNSNRLMSKVKDGGSEKYEYTYDENGNLTSKVVTKGEKVDNWEYSYDLLNQLEQVKKNGDVVSSYIYDPNGFRVEKVGGKGKIHYVPLLNGEVGYRKEFATDTEYSFIYVGGQHLARVNGVIGGNGKKIFYHNDHLGSALAVTDENGNKVVERDFTPFGERINTDVYDDKQRDADEDESGFTGKDWDEDVGLYYYNARWYDPGVGRFINQDPAGDDSTLYVYGFNNPLSYIDPSGQIGINIVGGLMNLAAREIPGLGDLMGVVNMFSMFVAGPSNTTSPESSLCQMSQGLPEIDLSEGISQIQKDHEQQMAVNKSKPQDIAKAIASDDPTNDVVTVYKANISEKSTKEVITNPSKASPGELQEATEKIVKNPDTAVSGPTLSEAAEMAEHVYKGKKGQVTSTGWTLVDIKTNESDGGSCRIGIYAKARLDGTVEYAFVNVGTSELVDWKDNIQQPFGASRDMKYSITQADNFVKANPDANITFIGHSKGGAEAAANAVATNRNAILFNPATVNLGAYGLNSSSYTGTMTAYIVKGEILNNIFGPISKPIGNAVYLPTQYPVNTPVQGINIVNSILNHLMPAVRSAVNEYEGR